uniref:Uncharacterized protein n=1 Tax=Cajanus cajan TaxID=3821 RepID=A0A151RSR0_CAJCA|nr:hypothetical protein KK1_032884 [Cajanus cajan]
MDKEKKASIKSFNNNETKYKAMFKIVNRRWDVQLHHPLRALFPPYLINNVILKEMIDF